ncbi:ubiquitin elongating factor core-domain-containing protein [Chytridium lagenaria]|nr:ubiquitin elongating factor core-domain-containing protein [Chytridium lagenaria]
MNGDESDLSGLSPDAIRAKRLAKIGTSNSTSLVNAGETSPEPPKTSNKGPTVGSNHKTSPLPEPQNRAVSQFLNLSFIFSVCLDEAVARAKGYTFLSSVVQDLTADTVHTLFHYLLSCWKKQPSGPDKDRAQEGIGRRSIVLDSCRELVITESFPQSDFALQLGPRIIAKKLLQDPLMAEEDLPKAFLDEFVQRFAGDGLDEILGPILIEIRDEALKRNIVTDFRVPMRTLGLLLSYKEIVNFVISKIIEDFSVLGPFFSRPACLSDSQGKIAETYFSSSDPFSEADDGPEHEGVSIGARNLGDVKSSMASLRDLIMLPIIKSSPDAREAVLNFLAKAIAVNYPRGRMQLVEPIMDPNYSKIHLIDPRFFNSPNVRLPLLQGTTLISADTEFMERCKLVVATDLGGKTMNFVTDHHPILRNFTRQIADLRKEIDRLKAERDSAYGGPMLKRLQAQLDLAISHKLLMDANLMDRNTIDQSLRFYNFVIIWLLRLASKGTKGFGGPDGPFWKSISFATLPEWIVDDIAEFFLFILRSKPILLESAPTDEISSYVKNPHLRNKLVEVLFFLTLPLYRSQNGKSVGPRLDAVLGTNEVSKRFLIRAIVGYYIDVEHSGVSSAFYDKFNVRYNISQIMKNETQFVKFANLLMNDTTYLLDESLTKLAEIHKIQDEMANTTVWQGLTRWEGKKEATLRQYERQAQSYVSLGNETFICYNILLLMKLSLHLLWRRILSSLAAMLDYNLSALVGPRCTELKEVMTEIVDIFLHLSHRSEFVQADLFVRAKNILMKNRLKSHDEIQALDAFVERVEHHLQNEREEERSWVISPTMLSSPMDPFNRKPLTADMLIPNTELKAKIDEWKRRAKSKEDMMDIQH